MRTRRLLLVTALAIVSGCSQDRSDESRSPQQTASTPSRAPQAGNDANKLWEDFERSLKGKGEVSARVVGGKKVQAGSYLAVVGLTPGGSSLPICTGTLIQPDIVLTAAHCICDHATSNIFIGDNASLSRKNQGYIRIRNWVSAIECNGLPGREIETRVNLDLAIVRTSRPVTGIEPMLFAPAIDIDRAKEARVIGFGARDRQGRIYKYEKEQAPVPILSSACQGADHADIFRCQADNEIVAGVRGGADTCNGDSGGPLLVGPEGGATEVPGDHRIAGVTSRPVAGASTRCGDGGVYERLTPFALWWISEATKRARLN